MKKVYPLGAVFIWTSRLLGSHNIESDRQRFRNLFLDCERSLGSNFGIDSHDPKLGPGRVDDSCRYSKICPVHSGKAHRLRNNPPEVLVIDRGAAKAALAKAALVEAFLGLALSQAELKRTIGRILQEP